jgi:hypothetical protein
VLRTRMSKITRKEQEYGLLKNRCGYGDFLSKVFLICLMSTGQNILVHKSRYPKS